MKKTCVILTAIVALAMSAATWAARAEEPGGGNKGYFMSAPPIAATPTPAAREPRVVTPTSPAREPRVVTPFHKGEPTAKMLPPSKEKVKPLKRLIVPGSRKEIKTQAEFLREAQTKAQNSQPSPQTMGNQGNFSAGAVVPAVNPKAPVPVAASPQPKSIFKVMSSPAPVKVQPKPEIGKPQASQSRALPKPVMPVVVQPAKPVIPKNAVPVATPTSVGNKGNFSGNIAPVQQKAVVAVHEMKITATPKPVAQKVKPVKPVKAKALAAKPVVKITPSPKPQAQSPSPAATVRPKGNKGNLGGNAPARPKTKSVATSGASMAVSAPVVIRELPVKKMENPAPKPPSPKLEVPSSKPKVQSPQSKAQAPQPVRAVHVQTRTSAPSAPAAPGISQNISNEKEDVHPLPLSRGVPVKGELKTQAVNSPTEKAPAPAGHPQQVAKAPEKETAPASAQPPIIFPKDEAVKNALDSVSQKTVSQAPATLTVSKVAAPASSATATVQKAEAVSSQPASAQPAQPSAPAAAVEPAGVDHMPVMEKIAKDLPPCLDQKAPANEYAIGVEDVLEINVLKPEELTNLSVVAPDGTITFPYIGNVNVKGRSIAQVQEEIQSKLADGYMRYPVVAVTLKESRSRKFFVYGEVLKPGPYMIEENMTVLRAISMAGGFTRFGSSSRVKVLRPRASGPGYDTIKVNIKALMEGNPSEDVLLRQGDIVTVSEGVF